jgi:hypothetical protein
MRVQRRLCGPLPTLLQTQKRRQRVDSAFLPPSPFGALGPAAKGIVVVVPIQGSEVRVQVLGLQRFGAIIEQATVGQEIGMQLKGIAPTLIAVGSVVKGPLLAE